MFLPCTVLGNFFLLKDVKIFPTLIMMINAFLILLCDVSCLLLFFSLVC